MTPAVQSVSRLLKLGTEDAEAFNSVLIVKHLKKKDLLIREGQVCDFAAFIASGCLRYYYNIEGKEKTGQFFFEGNWYADYESYLTGNTSRQNIEALEKTELYIIKKRDMDALYISHPVFEKFGRLMAETAYLGIKNKTEQLTTKSPAERYKTLMLERPKVIERIPQHYIASYLNIEPPSLSRIRKRLLGED